MQETYSAHFKMNFLRHSLLCFMLIPVKLLGLTFFFSHGEQWEIANPIKEQASTTAPQSTLALINTREGTIARITRYEGREIIVTRKFHEVAGMIWAEPEALTEAQQQIRQGNLSGGLATLDGILKFIEPWPKTPGSWWLKASLLKLTALEKLHDTAKLERCIAELAKNDNGGNPALTLRINLARLTLLNCQGQPNAALKAAEELSAKLDSPEEISLAHFSQGQAHLLLKNYEAALSFFLRICVFQGAHCEHYAQVLLGIAYSLHGLEGPSAADVKIHARYLAYLRRITTECPLSPEAVLAQSLLNQEQKPSTQTPQT